jgi:adenylate cyclase
LLLAGGSFAHLEPLKLSKSWHHVAALIALLGGVLPACFIQMLTTEQPRVGLVAFLTVHFLAVGLLMGWAVIRAVMGPVQVLHEQMQQVAEGHLTVRTPIQALDTMGALSGHFNTMVEGLEQRERIRKIFGRYVARQVAERILGGEVELGGERRTATVLFADIRKFTTLSEELSPEEVVKFLNSYFEVMVGCVSKHNGVLDKFIGDCIMALFGVPVSEEGAAADAQAAVACAREMCTQLAELNLRRQAEGLPVIEMGVGIHTGELVAGNIGTAERMEYTVIGDTVNVSARLESLTKEFQRPILISKSTAELLGDEVDLEEVSTIEVRGRKKPVTIFAING